MILRHPAPIADCGGGRQRKLAARHVLAHHALDWAERHGAPR